MNDAIRQAIREHAARDTPREACGLIVRRGKKSFAVACPNVAEDPRYDFLIHPDDWLRAEGEDGTVEMVYHSHPFANGTPTIIDKASSEAVGVPYLIYAPCQSPELEQWTTYEPCGLELPYEGRPFLWGVLDCWQLGADFWNREYGVTTPVVYRQDGFWQTQDLFLDNLHAEGCFEVDTPERGDLLLFAINMRNNNPLGRANHCAIYLGDGWMLHHPGGHNSRVEPFTGEDGYWAQHRHRQFAWRHPGVPR